MPKATSRKFAQRHEPVASTSSTSASSSGGGNPMVRARGETGLTLQFNTERFGQHILKNPLVAQGYVSAAC